MQTAMVKRAPTPANDGVLIRIEKKDTTPGGIVLPDTAIAEHSGYIVALGPSVDQKKTGLKTGVEVFLPRGRESGFSMYVEDPKHPGKQEHYVLHIVTKAENILYFWDPEKVK